MPYTYEDAIRVHDQAMMDWLGTFRCDYNAVGGATRDNVPCLRVMASPDRTYATVVDLLVSEKWISGADATQMRANADAFETIPMPFMSIQRLDPQPDAELTRPAGSLPKLVLNHTTQQWVPHPWPRFYYTQYIVTVWCLKKYTENLFRAWVMANLGKEGSAYNEAMVPVNHAEPWGRMLQRCRFDGSVDASELEGERPRYIRVDYNFTMRTLVMHLPGQSTDFADKIQTEIGTPQESYGITDTAVTLQPSPVLAQSRNLWSVPISAWDIPTKWPKDGAAAVSVSRLHPDAPRGRRLGDVNTGGLRIEVGATDDDAVELYERIAKLDGNGELLSRLSFRYVSDQPILLEMAQRPADGSTMTITLAVELPATSKWKRAEFYALNTAPLFSASIRGRSTATGRGTATLVDLDVRHINSNALLVPAGTVTTPTQVIYEWAGLTPGTYLLRGRVTAGSGVLTLENDTVAPTETRNIPVDVARQVGVALFVAPKSSSVRVTVPVALSLAGLSLSGYAGTHHGSEV
jgi:hypothetical protein